MSYKYMTQRSHAELECYHYQALKTNPFYRQEFMMDVFREEMSFSMPYSNPDFPKDNAEPPQPLPQPVRIRDDIEQLKSGFLFLQKKVNELTSGKQAIKKSRGFEDITA